MVVDMGSMYVWLGKVLMTLVFSEVMCLIER